MSHAAAVSLIAAGVAITLGIGLFLWLRARRSPGSSAGDLRLHRVADDVYLYRGFFSNSAVLVLPEGVVVVDTQVSPVAARRLRAAIEAVTDRPIRAVVNTHYHGDHSGGNAVFPEAEIVATDETARFVVERDDERVEYARTFGLAFQAIHPTVPPTRTFRDRTTIAVGGETIEVVQLGRVETPDACVVRWAARGVVASGDGVATIDYPYLGVPFLDEGLRDDASWTGFLDAIRAMRPRVLLPGHGPPLVGESVIAARLDLLTALMRDLLGAVGAELRAHTPIADLVERVDAKLARYRARPDLREQTVSQRFAIYRCVNNLSPERRGRGWWHDLRPSVIRRATRDACARERAAMATRGDTDVVACAMALASRDRPLALALLEEWTESHDGDAAAWAALADVLFDGARGVRPTVDATEYLAAAGRAADRALALDSSSVLALLCRGCLQVFGGMVLAQPMDAGIVALSRALATNTLSRSQRVKGCFFLGKAHQMELRDAESDHWYKHALPPFARPFYPLIRNRLRAYP